MSSIDDQFSGPIFVVGMPRSGTKLLRGLLNSHSRVGIPLNETEFLPYLERHWPQFGDLSRRDRFEAFYRWITGTFYFQNRLREHGKRIDLAMWYLACQDDFSLPNVFEQLIRHDAAVPSEGIWGDKSPSYLAHIEILKRVYPRAKIIHIVRDVRDYVLSMEKAFGKDRRRAAQRWVNTIRQAQRAAQSFAKDVHELQYEALLDNPREELEEICSFLGVVFEEQMLKLSRAPENLGDTAGETEIVAGNYGKYIEQMSEAERIEIEKIAAAMLQKLNYSCSYQGPVVALSKAELRRLQLRDAYCLIKKDSQRNGWVNTIRSRVGHFIKLRS